MSEIISFEKLINDPSKGWPTLDDFQCGRVFIDNQIVERVEDLLLKYKRCFIRCADGRGKTVLARVIAYNKHRNKYKIRFIDVQEISEEKINKICGQAEYAVKNEKAKTLFIVENAHISSDKIVPEIVKFAEGHPESFFIFTMRPEEEILNPFEEWEQAGLFIDLSPFLKDACYIVETFISTEKMSYFLTDQDKSWLEREFGREAVNLRRLKWYLEAWKKKGGPLASVEREEVLKEVKRYYLKELENNSELDKMLLNVAGVFQFDVTFHGEDYNANILKELTDRGTIRLLPGYYYRLKHSSDAAYIIEAEAILNAKKDPDTFTINILKEYLKKKPGNYYELMKALYQIKKKSILLEIFGDQEIYRVIFDMIERDRIKAVGSVLGYMTWACGKEKGLEFWSQYKKLGGTLPEEQKKRLKTRLNEAFLVEILFLLLFLKRADETEKDWLANNVLDVDILVQKAKDTFSTFSTILNLLNLLPNDMASSVISKLNPAILADKAKSSPPQSIMWILKFSLRDISNINFANLFLIEINKEGKLIEKLKDSDLGTMRECLRIIKRINSDLHKVIKDNLSHSLLQIWLSSGLSTIARQLYRYRGTYGESREFALSVVMSLSSIQLSEPIRKLFSKPESKPLKGPGRLLESTYQIAFKSDKDAIDKIAMQIVNNIDLRMQQGYTIKELSFLVNNVKKCSESAHKILCDRILLELNLLDYIRIPFDKGLAFLVWNIHNYNGEKGQEVANVIFRLDFNELLAVSDTDAVSMLLWNMIQINDAKVRGWVQSTSEDKWLSKALSSSTHDAFWLLWSLCHADEERGKGLVRSHANKVLSILSVVKTEDLPLLGFFPCCGIQLDLNIPIPSPYEIAEKICEDLSLSEVAFCLYFLKKKNDKLVKEFSKELGRQLFFRNLEFSVNEMLEKHPFDNTRQSLEEIFKGFEVPKEPDSTFAEMICLTKTYFNEKGEQVVAFSHLRDYFLNNPNENPLFRSQNVSRKWLNIAIEYGIFHKQQVPHQKDPSGIITLLSLNKDNNIVSSHLAKTEI